MTSANEKPLLCTPEPNLTSADVIDRARRLVPLLIEQQAETEARTFYSEEIHQAFVDSGLYLITHPRRYGGYEFGLETFFKVIVELARGCASTAWCYALGSGHSIALAAYWPEDVQEAILGEGPFIAPATFKPEGTARRVDGGWRISGTFKYCSGSPYANWFWGHAMTDDLVGPDGGPGMIQFLIPRAEWTRLDDWGFTLGLKGSGSSSIQIDDGYTSDLFVMENSSFMTFEPTGGTLGAELHGSPLYNGRPAAWFGTEFTALAVGMAKQALDVYSELMESQTTPFPPIIGRVDDYDYQLWYGEAVGRVAAAEAILDGAIAHMDRKARLGDFTVEDDLLVIRLGIETLQLCWDCVSRLLARTGGSSQMRSGARMERIYRDLSQLNSHNGFVLEGDTASRDIARLRFNAARPPANIRTLLPD